MGGVALGGPQHVAGGDIAEQRAGSVRFDRGNRCRFIDHRPRTLGRLRELALLIVFWGYALSFPTRYALTRGRRRHPLPQPAGLDDVLRP